MCCKDFPSGSVIKNPPANAGDTGSIPGSGRSPGEGTSNPLQYSCWEIPWTEETGRLQSMGWHDWVTQQQEHNKVGGGLPWWLSGKEFTYNAGNLGLIPGSWRSPGERNDNPLQYSCLRNAMDRGAWWARVHGVTKSQTQLKGLSTHSSQVPGT